MFDKKYRKAIKMLNEEINHSMEMHNHLIESGYYDRAERWLDRRSSLLDFRAKLRKELES